MTEKRFNGILFAANRLNKLKDYKQEVMRRLLIPSSLILATLLLLTPLLSLMPFRMGHYKQLEQILPAYWGLSGLAALWYAGILKEAPTLARRLISSPIVWGWFALSAVTGISYLYHHQSGTWFGSPQIGLGGILFICNSFSAMIFLTIKRFKVLQPYFLVLITLVAGTISILTALGSFGSDYAIYPGWPHAPLFFTDYISFYAPSLLAAFIVFSQGRIHRYIYWATGAILTLGILHLGINLSITYAFPMALAAYGLLKLPLLKSFSFNRLLGISAILGLILSAIGMVFYTDILAFISPGTNPNLTLVSRMYLARMTVMNFLVDPMDLTYVLNFLFGYGWSSYANGTLYNMFLVNDMAIFLKGSTEGQWEFLGRDLLHSHNIALETFHSCGFIGLIVLFYVFYKIIQQLPKRFELAGTLFLVPLLIGWATWFEEIHTVPFTIFGFALLFCTKPNIWKIKLPRSLFAFAGFLLLGLASVQFAFLLDLQKIVISSDFGALPKIYKNYKESWISNYDAFTGGHRQINILRDMTRSFQADAALNKTPNVPVLLKNLMDANHFLQRPELANRHWASTMIAMNIFGELYSFEPLKSALLKSAYIQEWHTMADKFMDRFPYRNDILIPYLNWLSTSSQTKRLFEVLERIKHKNPQDPIATWFEGLELMRGNDSLKEGVCKLNRALDHRIDRYMPIPDSKQEQLRQAGQQLGCHP